MKTNRFGGIMEELKKHMITIDKTYQEGEVFVLGQSIEDSESIVKANLFITALGMYEANLNGIKIGDQMFAPGFTYYPRELCYQTYDMTDLWKSGKNEFVVYLGQGWYCGRFTYDNLTQIYGQQVAVTWIIELTDKEGTKKYYFSDDDSVYVMPSPYQYAGLYDGEIIRKRPVGGATSLIPYSGGIPKEWNPTKVRVKIQEEMPIAKVIHREDFIIVDFGQNFAGIIEIDPAKMKSDYIRVRHGEILNPDGSLYTQNLRKAKAEIVFRKEKNAAAHSLEKYRPKFTYMGFRYIEITGCEYQDGLIKAYAIYSEMEITGYFTCINEKVQQLYENQVWGQKSNYVEVPTDCPQRDERMGYTGDGQVFAWTGSYNFEAVSFWDKFLADIRYSQMDNFDDFICSTVPASGPRGIGKRSMLGWGNAVTIVPEMLYLQYGTDEFFHEQYESMKKFVATEIRQMGEKDLWIGESLGDWLMPGKDAEWTSLHNNPISNAFIINDLRIIGEYASRIKDYKNAELYSQQRAKSIHAYIIEFIEPSGKMKDDYQGAYIMALTYVVEEPVLRSLLLHRLIELIQIEGMCTGFFSTRHILPLLAENGYSTLAFDLLLQENCNGWMYQINHGATTTWERWDAITPEGRVNETRMENGENMVSFNHYAFGSVGEFYYQYILGIRPLLPGYEVIGVRPFMDYRLGSVSGSYRSCRGLIRVAWTFLKENESSHYYEVKVVTPGTTRIELPDGRCYEVEKGYYQYQLSIPLPEKHL